MSINWKELEQIGIPKHMAETSVKEGEKRARELAKELLPVLETVANLHYLLDWHVVNPQHLQELRVTVSLQLLRNLKKSFFLPARR